MERKLRISNNSFEKSLIKFIKIRVFGQNSRNHSFRNESEFPSCFIKIYENNERIPLSCYFDFDDFMSESKKLINKYKMSPFKNTCSMSFDPKYVGFKPSTVIDHFVLRWNFDNEYLYFKFLIKFQKSKRNRKYKQMKIKWNNTEV